MPGPWYLSAALQTDVRNILKLADTETLAAHWVAECNAAETAGYRDLVTILLGKGFQMSQLDGWDFRASYSRQQCLFWLFTETALGIGYDDKEIAKLDHRKELTDATAIMINGAMVSPTADTDAGGIGGGVIDDSCYRINGSTEF